jgi:Ser/Thr protein kinase RdoA (MazF antagonist)
LTEAAAIAARFALDTPVQRLEPLGGGLINSSFLVEAGGSRWVLQRINGAVFPYPERIMDNLAALSAHLAAQPAAGLCVPGLVPAADGGAWVRGDDGAVWRLMAFIEGSRVLPRLEDEAQAREVGRALGAFHRSVHDLPSGSMVVTLPGFHSIPGYLDAFTGALRRGEGDRHPPEIGAAIAFVAARQGNAGVLEKARRDGHLPERVIHGDPKLDNILFDREGIRALGLIDLDTVQPGLVHYDIGDCLRSCCNRGGESSPRAAAPAFDLDLCRAILAAYAERMGDLLAPAEVALLYQAVRLIPFELGLRFLTDHLEGDRYFRVSAPGENLVRAGIQFALVEDIERKARQIRGIIAGCFHPNESARS